MKLLYDQNLSFRLVDLLRNEFPDALHVRDVGLATGTDEQVWQYAKREQCVLRSKDVDFQQRALLYGAPPKVVWLRIGNCSTDDVRTLLQARCQANYEFDAEAGASLLVLS